MLETPQRRGLRARKRRRLPRQGLSVHDFGAKLSQGSRWEFQVVVPTIAAAQEAPKVAHDPKIAFARHRNVGAVAYFQQATFDRFTGFSQFAFE